MFVEQLHSRGVFWRIRGSLPGGGAGSVGLGTRDSAALTIRMIACFGGFVCRRNLERVEPVWKRRRLLIGAAFHTCCPREISPVKRVGIVGKRKGIKDKGPVLHGGGTTHPAIEIVAVMQFVRISLHDACDGYEQHD